MASTNSTKTNNFTNLTKKQIQAYNIKNRTNISNHNSSTATIYNNIVNANYSSMKGHLFQLGVNVFQRYLNRIIKSSFYSDSKKAHILSIYNDIILNLSNDEQISLGLVEIPSSNEIIVEPDVEFTYFCKVYTTVGNEKHLIMTNLRNNDVLIPGKRYLFDLSDYTNLGTQLSFSYDEYSYTDIPGLDLSGVPGNSGCVLKYDIPIDIENYTIRIYDKADNSAFSYYIFPYIVNLMKIKINYKAISQFNPLESTTNNNILKCIKRSANIKSIEINGPKFVIEDSDTIYRGIDISTRYNSDRRYGLYYGSYTLKAVVDYNPFTILNIGKENLIQIKGDDAKKTTLYLTHLDKDRTLDGYYDLYYGDITIEVYGDFGSMSMYSFVYGINNMENILQFSDSCYIESGANTNYDLSGQGNIECLQPQNNFSLQYYDVSQVLLNDISSNGTGLSVHGINSINNNETLSFTVPQYLDQLLYYYSANNEDIINNFTISDYVEQSSSNTIIDNSNTSFEDLSSSSIVNVISSNNANFYVLNNGQNYISNKKYILKNGNYILKNISINHPLAILNNSQQDKISYEVINPQHNGADVPILIKVSGGSTTSINGDYYEFRNSSNERIYIANGSFRFMRGRTYRFSDYGITANQTTTTTDYYGYQTTVTITGHPFGLYLNGNLHNNKTISGNTNGQDYIDLTIPVDHSLNSPLNLYYQCGSHSSMKGSFNFLHQLNNNNDIDNDYFYGDIAIEVSDNFQTLSLECFYHGSMGGNGILIHEDYYNEISNNEISNNEISNNDVSNNLILDYYIYFDTNSNVYKFYDASNAVISDDPIRNIILYRNKNYNFTAIDICNQSFNIGSGWKQNEKNVELNVPYFVFNTGNSNFDPNKKYGLAQGQYLIFNIPESNPIAFINNNKNDYFTYVGNELNKIRRLGPDGFLYDFYFGSLIVYVYGDFGTISCYDFYNGYLNGKFLFVYSDICSYPNNINNIKTEQLIDVPSSYDNTSENIFNEITDYNVIKFEDYMNFNIINNTIIFNDPINTNISYNPSNIYLVSSGNFVIMNVPETHPIAFLNKNIEHIVNYDGYFPFKTTDFGPDGFSYDFYYGNINLYISGNFGRLSIYVKNRGFLQNGRKILNFISSNDYIGDAIPQNSLKSAYPNLETNYNDATPRDFYIGVDVVTNSLPYSLDYSSYIFYGYDRDGLIDSTELNPRLKFFLGDRVFFNFTYDNSTRTFGIYERANLISNPQIISNNATTNQQTEIQWTPTITIPGFYYYRSISPIDLMFNNIDIIDNGLIDITPRITSITPSYDSSNVSIMVDKFEINFDEIININSAGTLQLYKYVILSNPELIRTYNGNEILGSGSKKATIDTNYDLYTNINSYSRLDFSSNYFIKISNDLFENIYKKNILAPYYLDNFNNVLYPNEEELLFKFRTEPPHPPILTSIEFLDTSNTYVPLQSSSIIDSSAVIQFDNSDNLLDLNGELRLTFSENIIYDYNTYNNPTFTQFDRTGNNGVLNTTVNNNILTLNYNEYTTTGFNYSTLDESNNLVPSTYKLNIQPGSVFDASYVNFDINDSSLNLFSITIKTDPRPLLVSISPDYEETAVPVDASFILTFDKLVYPGSSGYFFIREQLSTNNFQVFDFTDPLDISAISGWGTNTISFTTPTPLQRENYENFTNYTLIIEGTTIKTGNTIIDEFYPGLNDPLTYYFRTETGTS